MLLKKSSNVLFDTLAIIW